MKIGSIRDVRTFQTAIEKCKDNVWLRSFATGQNYNLKSALSQYVGIAQVIMGRQDFELFTDAKDDERHFLRMFDIHPEML